MAKYGDLQKIAEQYKWSTLFHDKKLKGKIPDTVKPNYKNGVSDWIGRTKSDTSPVLYISSIAGDKQWNEDDFTKMTGVNHRCYSYAYCGVTSPLAHKKHTVYLKYSLEKGAHIFLDSGAHSLHRMLRSGKTLARVAKVSKEMRTSFIEYITEEFIQRYAEYVRWTYGQDMKFDFWVTLDAQKNCEVIYKVTKRLQKMIGIAPIPVYHGDRSLDWVRRYIDDGHKLLGVGIDSRRIKGRESRHRYYSELHDLTIKHGMATHGFAVTGQAMFTYPFFSVDSATHIKAASFGKILQVIPEKSRVAQIHISDNYSENTAYGNISALSPNVKKSVIAYVESKGFDYESLVKSLTHRIYFNAKVLRDAVEINTKKKVQWKTWQALV